MNSLMELPMLAGLPRVELAKLLADLEESVHPAGEVLLERNDSGQWLTFVVTGRLEVRGTEGGRKTGLMVVGPGEILGDWATGSSGSGGRELLALTAVSVCRLPREKVVRLFPSDPRLVEEFISQLSARLATVTDELARVKLMMASYSDELWDEVPLPHLEAAPAAMPVEAPKASAQPGQGWIAWGWVRRLFRLSARPGGLLLSTAIAFVLARTLGQENPSVVATAILLWATLNWLLDTLPDYAVGLSAIVALAVLGAVTPAVALSGFANPAWFLLIGAGGIGVAVSRSGLLYRMALQMLRLLPPTYRGQSLAMALTGLLFTPLLPSANSRVAMAGPLARELSEAMHFREHGRGAAGLAMSTFLGFGLMYFLFLNGANTGLLAWSLLPSDVQQQITWTAWFWSALPPGLLVFCGCYGAILLLYRPEATPGVSRNTIRTQLQILGPMNRSERITAGVLALVMLAFLTQFLHGLDPAWLAVSGFLLLVGLGVVDKQGLRSIDWGFLILFGTLISLSEVAKRTGISEQLTIWVAPGLHSFGASPYLFLTAVGLLTLLIRLVVPLQPTVFMLVVSLSPVAAELGYSPFVVALVVLALSNNWVVPQQNSVYLGIYSATEERSFTHRQTRPLALLHALICLLAFLATVPFWRILGLLPS